MMPRELCQKIAAQMEAFLQGALADHQLTAFRTHLKACSRCCCQLRSLTGALHSCDALPEETISKSFRQRMMDCYREWKRGAHPPCDDLEEGAPIMGRCDEPNSLESVLERVLNDPDGNVGSD